MFLNCPVDLASVHQYSNTLFYDKSELFMEQMLTGSLGTGTEKNHFLYHRMISVFQFSCFHEPNTSVL